MVELIKGKAEVVTQSHHLTAQELTCILKQHLEDTLPLTDLGLASLEAAWITILRRAYGGT